MHERQRWQSILKRLSGGHLATIAELARETGASAATLRRDIAKLDAQGLARKLHGGAEGLTLAEPRPLATRSFEQSHNLNLARKRAIANAAAALCHDGEQIIINGGTTTFEMVYPLRSRHMQILTNSFPIAESLIKHSRNRILLPGGEVYREQNIILSPYHEDAIQHHYASTMFMSALAIAPVGLMEGDPLLIRAERKLIDRAEKLVVLADSSKFRVRGGLVLCPLQRIHTLITDEDADETALAMLAEAGIAVIIAKIANEESSAA